MIHPTTAQLNDRRVHILKDLRDKHIEIWNHCLDLFKEKKIDRDSLVLGIDTFNKIDMKILFEEDLSIEELEYIYQVDSSW